MDVSLWIILICMLVVALLLAAPTAAVHKYWVNTDKLIIRGMNLTKLDNNISRILNKQERSGVREAEKQVFVVLVTSGAFDPVRRYHHELMKAAKSEVEKQHRFSVVAGFHSDVNE